MPAPVYSFAASSGHRWPGLGAHSVTQSLSHELFVACRYRYRYRYRHRIRIIVTYLRDAVCLDW